MNAKNRAVTGGGAPCADSVHSNIHTDDQNTDLKVCTNEEHVNAACLLVAIQLNIHHSYIVDAMVRLEVVHRMLPFSTVTSPRMLPSIASQTLLNKSITCSTELPCATNSMEPACFPQL